MANVFQTPEFKKYLTPKYITIGVFVLVAISVGIYFIVQQTKSDKSNISSGLTGEFDQTPTPESTPQPTTSAPTTPRATTPVPTTPAPTSLQAPTIVDHGHTNKTRGWYNAEGLGCYNYCRYVGRDPNVWFSCMLVDRNGSTTSPKIYTEAGVYTEEGLASKKC